MSQSILPSMNPIQNIGDAATIVMANTCSARREGAFRQIQM
jgi:hypothetical protein